MKANKGRDDLPISRLRELFSYEPNTGELIWKERPAETFKSKAGYVNFMRDFCGRSAGTVSNRGYLRLKIQDRSYLSHRVIWAFFYGEWPSAEIDHINGVKTDNRILNLRNVSMLENERNKSRPENNTSGYIGVWYRKDKDLWQAAIRANGIRYHLGYHETPELAYAARLKKQKELGFHENHGR